MVDIAFFFSAASLAASSCLPNFCDLLIIRGALKYLSKAAPLHNISDLFRFAIKTKSFMLDHAQVWIVSQSFAQISLFGRYQEHG